MPAPQTFYGVDIYVHADMPRYLLPERLKLPCGYAVEWPEGFRDGFNQWSRSFLGYTGNLIPDGEVWNTADGLHVNPRTYAAIDAAIKATAEDYRP